MYYYYTILLYYYYTFTIITFTINYAIITFAKVQALFAIVLKFYLTECPREVDEDTEIVKFDEINLFTSIAREFCLEPIK